MVRDTAMADQSATFDDPLSMAGGPSGDDYPTLAVAFHVDAGAPGARRVLIGGPLVLGRRSEAFGPRVLDDGLLSREHLRLEPRADGILAVDLDSRNGTFVNGERVKETVLRRGDVVGIGSVMFVFDEGPLTVDVPRDPDLAGTSHRLARVLADIEAVAAESVTVVVEGETGVGKERVARRIHERSGREGNFVALNCGGVAEGLAQSELFGHARGAFSGAEGERAGLVESAADGTLLLDEIGDASPALQTTLLRLLENREYRRVGSDQLRTTDARFVAATHVDLDDAVERGRFRRDLLSRLRKWVIRVPSLRERRQDVIPIALAIARRSGRPRARFSRPLAQALLLSSWHDNVRGLAGAVEQALVESPGEQLELTPRLEERLGSSSEDRRSATPPGGDAPAVEQAVYKKQRPEPDYLRRRFVELGCNMKAFARELGIARNTLYRWFEEAEIDPKTLRG